MSPVLSRLRRVPARVAMPASRRIGATRLDVFAARVKRPCFIVGCGRSGTTMLNHLFDFHPEVANFPSEANKLWHPQLHPWHHSTVDAPPFLVDPNRYTEISLSLRRPEDDLRLKATFGAYQLLTRKPVFLNKSVMITFMLDRVVEVFPDARFIHLVRDGRAVALSYAVKDWHKLDYPRFREQGFQFDEAGLLEAEARHWQEHILALDEAVDRLGLRESGRYLEMTYEALCADPPAHLVKLAGLLGVSPEPFLRASHDHIRNTNHKARSSLDAAMIDRLNRAAGRALARKGYSDQIA